MRRFFLIFVALLVACGAARADFIIIPASSATNGDTGGAGAPLNGNPLTTQFIFGSSLLNDLPIGSQIDGIFFRLVEHWPTGPANDITFNNFNITISQSKNALGSLSMTFADNIGAAATLVRSGSLIIPTGSYLGGSILNPFGPEITFTTPYTYTGGDLLFTIQSSSTGGFDNLAVNYGGDSTVMQTVGGDYNATTGNFGVSSSPVLQLDYTSPTTTVPEPTTLTLLATGVITLSLMHVARRKRRKLVNNLAYCRGERANNPLTSNGLTP